MCMEPAWTDNFRASSAGFGCRIRGRHPSDWVDEACPLCTRGHAGHSSWLRSRSQSSENDLWKSVLIWVSFPQPE